MLVGNELAVKWDINLSLLRACLCVHVQISCRNRDCWLA